ncbi:hypothetical protein JCM10049v2_005889 [Rhodotorula toruloides]
MVGSTAENTSSAAATARQAHDAPPDLPTPEPGAGGASTSGDHDEAIASGQHRTSLLDLSDELLHRIFAEVLALENAPVHEDDRFGRIRVNKRIWRIGLPIWTRFLRIASYSVASSDRNLAILAQDERLHDSVRQVALSMNSDGPRRLGLIVVARLPHLADLCLQMMGDVFEHPVDVYLDIIGDMPSLARFRFEADGEIVVRARRSTFRALRCLDVFGGSVAQSILEARGMGLVKLRVTLFSDSAVPVIPWASLASFCLAGSIANEQAAWRLLAPLKELHTRGKLGSVGLTTLAVDLTDTGKSTAIVFIAAVFSLIDQTALKHIDLATSKDFSWMSLKEAGVVIATVQSLRFDGPSNDGLSDVDHWSQLARLLSFFPNLIRLEVTRSTFNSFPAFQGMVNPAALTPPYVAEHFPVLSAILQYLRYRAPFRALVISRYDQEIRATRAGPDDDFKLERWHISAAEHDMFLDIF